MQHSHNYKSFATVKIQFCYQLLGFSILIFARALLQCACNQLLKDTLGPILERFQAFTKYFTEDFFNFTDIMGICYFNIHFPNPLFL